MAMSDISLVTDMQRHTADLRKIPRAGCATVGIMSHASFYFAYFWSSHATGGREALA
jgi:hypothetical protein